ncbi:uncharacterized protein LOC107462923 [Arachis duranensis]|uniref:Uncharacterized protein LOC107462923 n=1 Tax=Arachis duranensis TaxID=130453 RepID=A0A6P5MJP7_ARADU|nr:uncharacterized protein LOC107462923 [Arachis duranensis]XP_052108567.1 uncharacterized protein LOC107462923 [Arachis duranensis]XP_052108568.1 uncharacterized protein LOC107462923 [Arachis duranensis]XP_052108569.1 uncharacterized protein LOC107462923 [Arachis duranensis]XP_052108570.1 uncharacterized protein LOC107462923 [Arachis duranensis]
MDLKSGLRELKSDGDAMKMARSLVSSSYKHCEVYVVDGVRESNGIEITSTDADYVPEGGEDSANNDGLLEVEMDAESEPSTEEEVFDDSADDGDHEDHFGFEVEDNDPQSNAFGGFMSPLNDERTAAAGTAEGGEGLREGDEQVGGISDGYETDDIDSYEGDSDDMIKKKRFPKYNEAEMNREYEFQVGLEFKSLSQFKEAVKEHALLNGRDIRFRKNDKVRCRVVCKGRKGKCKWVCFASKVGDSDYFRIKTLNRKHTCGRIYSEKLASSSWISKKIANNISRGEEMKLAIVIQTIQDKYMANISVGKAYWARRKAREEVHGRAIQQYAKLRDYCAEILRANPGSSLSILVDRPSITHQPRFMRMYMCLDAVKKGFLAGCRPIIGMDGCHLKGDHGQQLLVAVGRDPNDNYFSIAVAVVEAETKDSWGWFLELLLNDIGESRKWVFMSDQQKGLMDIFQEALPTLEHRLCLRHLYANCKKAYGGGIVLRDLILSIAKATYVEEWERKMNQLKKINRDYYDKLFALDPKLWTKSHFTFLAKSDMLMNNISEAFNGRILEARDKPILTMFEWIRCYLMTRFVEKKKKAERFEGSVLPKPKKRLDIIAVRAMEWQAKWAGDLKFEVHHKNRMIMERYVVDLMVGRCSCRF